MSSKTTKISDSQTRLAAVAATPANCHGAKFGRTVERAKRISALTSGAAVVILKTVGVTRKGI